MRGATSQPEAAISVGSPQRLTNGFTNNNSMTTTASTIYHPQSVPSFPLNSMRLKMTSREVSERRQVGDMEEMLGSNSSKGVDDSKGV